jgi:hypothetical protein
VKGRFAQIPWGREGGGEREEGKGGGRGGGGEGAGRGGRGARASVRACTRACTRRLTCPLLPNVNYDTQSGDTKMTKFRSKRESADVRFGMRNQNNTRTEFHIANRQFQCRYRAINSGIMAMSRAPLSGDVVLDCLEEVWWLNERWWTNCIENEILCTHLSHPMSPRCATRS